ncbi:hypothetical protein [Arthrobacter sp. SLBN-53]|uniref:hypothetical protein n=1 Tax=Arthrobacter sp. SLBN-53 TaxID=2768412 RepID=UPI0011521E95|nr:hypothetical protein [Arthrobacter sp. SLBN-53]TQK27963.1 hypothetical protein FBY28_0928 [Arthrobacter sp. SLBN-53]
MLEWLKDELTIADSGFAVLGGLIVAAGYSVKPLRRRWQRRPSQIQKQQAAKLDQIGLGRPLETIEAVLGSPHLLNRWRDGGDDREERIYRLPGAWVSLHILQDAVAAYSITITDEKLSYDTGKITRGIVPVTLGSSVFTDARPDESAIDVLETYPRFSTFYRYYDYGCTAAGGKFIWLAFHPYGAGEFAGAHEVDWEKHKTEHERATTSDLSRITVNTIAICDWNLQPRLASHGFYGPHPDLIRD